MASKTSPKPKPTVAQLKQKVEELLTIKDVADRYAELKEQIKADMVALNWKEVDIPGKGNVFISPSTKNEYSTALAEDVLGVELASKIIQVKRAVSSEILAAFIKAGEITEAQADLLEKRCEKKAVVALNIRPLK
jgi:hypothetical protein